MSKHSRPIETLDPAQVARLLKAGKVLLIDVREPVWLRDDLLQALALPTRAGLDILARPRARSAANRIT
jgi:rhodanese-related sulfurtransferase